MGHYTVVFMLLAVVLIYMKYNLNLIVNSMRFYTIKTQIFKELFDGKGLSRTPK